MTMTRGGKLGRDYDYAGVIEGTDAEEAWLEWRRGDAGCEYRGGIAHGGGR